MSVNIKSRKKSIHILKRVSKDSKKVDNLMKNIKMKLIEVALSRIFKRAQFFKLIL